jgi:hypothetical protein
MRYFTIATILLLPILAMQAACAEDLPQPVTALIGPGIGYLLAQSDLCQWDMNGQIKAAYQNSFNEMGLSAAQQATIWQAAAARQKKLADLPAAAKAGMKSGTCGPDFRAHLEAQISK